VAEMRNIYLDFVGRRERKRQPGRQKPRWEDNFKIDVKIGYSNVN
jgi:hypothetical protein